MFQDSIVQLQLLHYSFTLFAFDISGMGCGQSTKKTEQEAAVDKQLKEDAKVFHETIKLLLLGNFRILGISRVSFLEDDSEGSLCQVCSPCPSSYSDFIRWGFCLPFASVQYCILHFFFFH
jgi:hypothetical protein